MKKEIKRFIEKQLFKKDLTQDWQTLINKYYESVKDTAKGVVLKSRYFDKKKYWKCINELQKIKVYYEKDNFYRIVNEIINDILLRASFERLINPYEFETSEVISETGLV